jgi:hypothetical protein
VKTTFVAPLQVIEARLQELPIKSTIDSAMIAPRMMLLNNEHKILCLTTSLVNRYHPIGISLDFINVRVSSYG